MAHAIKYKGIVFFVSKIAILCMVFQIPAIADSAVRTKAIEDRASQRIELYRKKFGSRDGRLAAALESMWGYYENRDFENIDKPLIAEWLEIYPQIPPADQRYCAQHALYFARGLRTFSARHFDQPSPAQISKREIGLKIALCVLESMDSSSDDWSPEKNLTAELNMLAKSPYFPEEVKQLARKALSQKMRAEVAQAHELVCELKKIYELPDVDQITTKASNSLEQLRSIFPKLREMDKRDLAGDILNITALAIRRNKIPAEKLLWTVFDNVNPAWMDNGNSISAGLLSNASYYFQTEKNFALVAKLYERANEFLDFDGSGHCSRGEFHMVLGDTYLLLKREGDAKEEFETALKIENSYLNSGLYDGFSEGADLTKTRIIERLQKFK